MPERREITSDRTSELSANIDDMTAEDLGAAMELLLEEGALDVWFTPIQMKKNRPAVMLSLLCPRGAEERFAELILRHTTTFGVRITEQRRFLLEREITVKETELGPCRLKKGLLRGSTIKEMPEYEDLKKMARENSMSLSEVRRAVEDK